MSTDATPADDVIKAAMSIAKDAAEGRLDPADLDAELAEQCRQLVGQVVGEGDPLFALQCQIARGVLAVGGIPADELGEFLALARRRKGRA
ncbi:flagellar hook-length control protein [Mycobacterium vicinigordonae]|uniref:Flagellar hook-length control protein n=1 Tax=Mycobacterium vicinigordonae TaxID=1719132 RepID=A0A7D6E1I4_9MYCO|nr:flagellar hook-length control protein [Mycobacterium vicinigordonae]QLL08849.1 flagellar hook-length control protein [Mycobacterium vicinigordonae]